MAARMVRIYTISDGPGGPPVYVGKTHGTLRKRLTSHIFDARRLGHRPLAQWVRGLLEGGREPHIEELDSVQAGDDWVEAERFWIAQMRAFGFRLLNVSEGGEGTAGYSFTPEQRERLRIAHAGQVRRPSTVEKFRRTMAEKRASGWRKQMPPDAGRKSAQTRRQRYPDGVKRKPVEYTAELRARISAARRAVDSPEFRARISMAKRGRKTGPMPESQRRALSVARRALNLSRPVIGTPTDGGEAKKFESTAAAAVAVGGLRGNINSAIKGRLQTAYGHRWQYASN